MAKKAEPDDVVAPPPPSPPAPFAADGAMEGDPVVFVRMLTGSDLVPYRVKAEKQRQIQVDGRPCEHVSETDDGTWVYQMRAF